MENVKRIDQTLKNKSSVDGGTTSAVLAAGSWTVKFIIRSGGTTQEAKNEADR